jgi:hypothetical protein
MRRGLILLLVAVGTAAAADPFPNADSKAGAQFHEKHCVACHIRLYGSDGSKIYTRKERVIRTPQALLQRVATCNAQINAGLFPEEEAHVAAHLNERYYQFK